MKEDLSLDSLCEWKEKMSNAENPPKGKKKMTTEKNDVYLVAIDDGYAQTKVIGQSPNGLVKFKFRTAIRSGRHGLKSLNGEGVIGGYSTEEGEEFTVSDLIETENTQFDGFHTSIMNRVLVAHALTNSGYGGKHVSVITGLPVGDYFLANGDVDMDKIEKKVANLKKGVKSISKNELAIVDSVSVGCQAVSAWIDYMLDDDLNFKRDLKGHVAIIDIGGRTTDIALVINNSGNPVIDHSKSGTANIGVLDVYKALGEMIKTEFKIKDEIPLQVLDESIRSKKIELFGEEIDVSTMVASALKEIDGKIAREINRKIGTAATLKAVVFVGGGSSLLSDVVKEFKNGILAEDPEYANARGLLKFEKLKKKMTKNA